MPRPDVKPVRPEDVAHLAIMSCREAAVYTRLSERTLCRLALLGKLPRIHVGRRALYVRADLDKLLQPTTVAA